MRLAAWLAILGLAAPLAHAAAPDRQAGQDALDRRDPAAAEHVWQQAAAAGDRRAAFSLGLLYDSRQDPARAFRCYLVAAEGGLPEAEFNVAVMLDAGGFMARDTVGAATWYARAASNGHARAAYDLAQLYAAGDGVPRNPVQATAWLRAAAANGIAAARRPPQHVPSPVVTMGPLLPMVLAPAAVVRPSNADRARAELVWLAPAQPLPARAYVAVYRADPDGLHEVFAAPTALSAITVELPPDRAEYVWRVYTLADGDPHYAASPWGHLQVLAAPDSAPGAGVL